MKGTFYNKDTRIDGKVVIITGANTGIGKETAIDLARRGGKVYIACRDLKRGVEALRNIRKEGRSEDVHFLQLDLASLDSVKEFSTKFHQLESKLHVLINNAAVMGCPRSLTKDGFEMQFGTNHLGHFLLTNLLLDLLKAGAPSRIVVVSALLHKRGEIKKDDLMGEISYGRQAAYCHSKLANNLFSHELARKLKGTGVTSNSLHPGVIVTELSRHYLSDGLLRTVIDYFASFFLKNSVEGAQTTICLAVDPDLEKVSGKYFNDCAVASESDDANNEKLASWLWEKSEELVGLKLGKFE